VIFLNVLQAINEWGNSVSLQAQSLTQYNIELANLERETGTILETHGIFLYEDRFCSLGPLWLCPNRGKLYPEAIVPGDNVDRYEAGDEPAEQFFNLDDYPRRLPAVDEPLPYEPAEPLPDALPDGLPEGLPSELPEGLPQALPQTEEFSPGPGVYEPGVYEPPTLQLPPSIQAPGSPPPAEGP
jgi:hypothetical protein